MTDCASHNGNFSLLLESAKNAANSASISALFVYIFVFFASIVHMRSAMEGFSSISPVSSAIKSAILGAPSGLILSADVVFAKRFKGSVPFSWFGFH